MMLSIRKRGEGFKTVNSFRGFYKYIVPMKLESCTDIVLNSLNDLDSTYQLILVDNL